MSKAIPVFKFAFASYAASGAATLRAKGEARRRLTTPPPFRQNLRVPSSEDGLLVKIGVRDGELCEAVLAPKSKTEDYREIWLGDISQTASAFSGVVRRSQTSFRHIRPGQRIGFDPTHILEWSIGGLHSEDCAPEDSTRTLGETAGS